jgi:gas vesicle structural protein
MPDVPLHPDDELSLADVVNRVLDRGAVVSGDVVISVAGVDLVYLGLRLVLSSVEGMRARDEQDAGA